MTFCSSPHTSPGCGQRGRPSLWRVKHVCFPVDDGENICAHAKTQYTRTHHTQFTHSTHAHTTYMCFTCKHTHTQQMSVYTHTQYARDRHARTTHSSHVQHMHTPQHAYAARANTHTNTTPMHTRCDLLQGGEVPELCSPLVTESPCAWNTHTLHVPMTCLLSGNRVRAEVSSRRRVAGRKQRNWVLTWP